MECLRLPENAEKPDAVFFDWDGTLVDTLPGLLLAHNYVREQFALPLWTRDEFYQQMKFSSRELYPMIYGDKAPAAFDHLKTFMDENHLKHLHVLEHSGELLKQLHEAGIPVGIVSNKRHEFLIREVTHLDWGRYVRSIIGAGKSEKDKPSGIPIRNAMAEAKVSPDSQKVWYVGDSDIDMVAARDAGCVPVLIFHGKDNDEVMKTHSPPYVFQDCIALAAYLSE